MIYCTGRCNLIHPNFFLLVGGAKKQTQLQGGAGCRWPERTGAASCILAGSSLPKNLMRYALPCVFTGEFSVSEVGEKQEIKLQQKVIL